jgi:hypothetical protein
MLNSDEAMRLSPSLLRKTFKSIDKITWGIRQSGPYGPGVMQSV